MFTFPSAIGFFVHALSFTVTLLLPECVFTQLIFRFAFTPSKVSFPNFSFFLGDEHSAHFYFPAQNMCFSAVLVNVEQLQEPVSLTVLNH